MPVFAMIGGEAGIVMLSKQMGLFYGKRHGLYNIVVIVKVRDKFANHSRSDNALCKRPNSEDAAQTGLSRKWPSVVISYMHDRVKQYYGRFRLPTETCGFEPLLNLKHVPNTMMKFCAFR